MILSKELWREKKQNSAPKIVEVEVNGQEIDMEEVDRRVEDAEQLDPALVQRERETETMREEEMDSMIETR